MSAVVPSLRGSLRDFRFLAWQVCGSGYMRRRDASPDKPIPLLSMSEMLGLLHLLATGGWAAKYLTGDE